MEAPSCIHALFRANEDGIGKYCQTQFHTHHHQVHRLAADTWLVTTSQLLEMEVSCPGVLATKHTLQGSLLITLNPGCIGNTNTFSIKKTQFESDVTFKNSIITEVPDFSPFIATELDINSTNAIKTQIQSIGKPLTSGEIRQATLFKEELKEINNKIHPLNLQLAQLSNIHVLLSCHHHCHHTCTLLCRKTMPPNSQRTLDKPSPT